MCTEKKNPKIFLICLLLNSIFLKVAVSQESANLFFGQKPPGDSAIIFDIGVQFPESCIRSHLCFAPNGTDCYFTVLGKRFARVKNFLVRYENGKYSKPVETNFSTGYRTANEFISNNGKKLYFQLQTLEFSGIPEKNEELEIILIVRNTTNYYITDQLKLTIKGVSDVKKVQDEIWFFPDPTSGIIYIDLKDDLCNITYRIIDLNEKKNMQEKLIGNSLEIIGLSRDFYNIILGVNGEQVSKNII